MANLKIPWTCDMGDEEAWEFAARENVLMMYPPAWLHGYLDACESVREDSLKERLKREQMGDENME